MLDAAVHMPDRFETQKVDDTGPSILDLVQNLSRHHLSPDSCRLFLKANKPHSTVLSSISFRKNLMDVSSTPKTDNKNSWKGRE